MRFIRSLVAAPFLIALVVVAACNKDRAEKEPSHGPSRSAAVPTPAAPPLFAHIPADTPFAFASFRPLPKEFWGAMGDTFRGFLETVLDQILAQPADDPAARFGHALVREVRNNLSAAGLKKVLGLSHDARFALHGVGIVPVFRLELADSKALAATITRLAQDSGLVLPTATEGGRSYYRLPSTDTLVVGAILDDHLVIAAGPTALVDKALPLILGIEKPRSSMADGSALRDVVARHGFSPYGVGFIDSSRLLNIVALAGVVKALSGGAAVSPACTSQISALAARFPRVVLGYDDVGARGLAARIVVEIEPALLARVRQLQVEIPGMRDGALAEPALVALGGGIDLTHAQQLARGFADALEEIGEACGEADMVADAQGMKEKLAQELPPGVRTFRGGLFAVTNAAVSQGVPKDVAAYAIVAAADSGALLDHILGILPTDKVPVIARDGAYHELFAAGALPGVGAIQGAVKDKALVVATGPSASAAADRALSHVGRSPLFLLSYDYARIAQIGGTTFGQVDAALPGLSEKLGLFGQTTLWSYVSELGLALAYRMEIRK